MYFVHGARFSELATQVQEFDSSVFGLELLMASRTNKCSLIILPRVQWMLKMLSVAVNENLKSLSQFHSVSVMFCPHQ
jgi:hypothetical protein